MTIERFTEQWLAPFRASPFSLRFELGGETFGDDAPVPRFTQAFDRATKVAQDVFELSDRVFALVAAFSGLADDISAPGRDGFGALAAAGFRSRPMREWRAPTWPSRPGQEDRAPCDWRSFDLGGDPVQRDVLLWCAISSEIAVEPKASVSSFLADPDRKILLHVYDDRGMDVTALEREALLTTYRSRQAWLLDHDRKRMSEAFGEAA